MEDRGNRPLIHNDVTLTDVALTTHAKDHFGKNRFKQVVAFVLSRMRQRQYKGMTSKDLHDKWPALARLQWLAERPDLRQIMVTDLVGTKPKMARKRALPDQAKDIEDTLECGDISVAEFDRALPENIWATYGDAQGVMQLLITEFDWADTKNATLRTDVADFINQFLLVDGGLPPILTHLQVRRAIDNMSWTTNVPPDVRAAIDEARLSKQDAKPTEPFTAKEELAIATPDKFVEWIPLEDLANVFLAAMDAMSFVRKSVADMDPPTATNSTPTLAPAAPSDDGPKASEEAPAPKPVTSAKPPPLPSKSTPRLPAVTGKAGDAPDDFDKAFDAVIDDDNKKKPTDPKGKAGV